MDDKELVELAELKARIDSLQTLYVVLFMSSLGLLVLRYVLSLGLYSYLLWAILLGGALICRTYRTSLVNKYNARLVKGRVGPIE